VPLLLRRDDAFPETRPWVDSGHKPRVADVDSQLAGSNGPPQSDLASAPAAKIDPADGYLERMVKYLRLRSSRSSRSCLERMVKYVPAEIIAFQQELVVERPRLVDVLAG